MIFLNAITGVGAGSAALATFPVCVHPVVIAQHHIILLF